MTRGKSKTLTGVGRFVGDGDGGSDGFFDG